MASAVLRMLRTAGRRRDELLPLLHALWRLPAHQERMRVGKAGVQHAFHGASDAASSGSPTPEQRTRAQRLARVVSIAADHGATSGTCLTRSLTLLDLLRRERIPARLQIGVRNPGDDFAAHAWVECGSLVLEPDPASISRYTVIGR